jgi:N-methylhydantoinase A
VNGEIPLTLEHHMDGIPIKVPMLDIHTVGAGGGSMARIDPGGALKVGPQSAGANPGPVCYGKGRQITVSDANLFLGRLDEDRFLGGRIHLDRERTVLEMKRLAAEVKLSPMATAWGIVRVVNSNMERLLRAVSVERGLDPKDFTLVAFGGAGGMHAAELVEGLRVAHILVPERPGLLSAWGIAQAPLVWDFSLSVLTQDPEFRALKRLFARLVKHGLQEVQRDRIPQAEASVYLSLDMRYSGQAYEITVPFDKSFIGRFHAMHEARFGHCDRDHPVEGITLRARIEGRRKPMRMRPLRAKRGRGRQTVSACKAVYFREGLVRCPIYEREHLNPGGCVTGPAVICEFSSTVVVPPEWRAEMDGYKNLHLFRK